jgi:hypothetical protein
MGLAAALATANVVGKKGFPLTLTVNSSEFMGNGDIRITQLGRSLRGVE